MTDYEWLGHLDKLVDKILVLLEGIDVTLRRIEMKKPVKFGKRSVGKADRNMKQEKGMENKGTGRSAMNKRDKRLEKEKL